MFSGTANLPERPDAIGMSAFDDLVALVAEILDAADDDRDPTFVALQVHTWIHGIVTLVACAPAMAWPSMDDLLDDLVVRLGLAAPRPALAATADARHRCVSPCRGRASGR